MIRLFAVTYHWRRPPFTAESCARFVAAKEQLWAEHGYGPWAFFVDGEFAGWGGLSALDEPWLVGYSIRWQSK